MNITQDDIALIKDEKNKNYFPKCLAALEAYGSAADENAKKQQAVAFLQNYAPEKTLYILNTDERLGEVRKKISEAGKWEAVKDINSFVTIAQEIAGAEIAKFMEQNGNVSSQNNNTKNVPSETEQPASESAGGAEGQGPANGQGPAETTEKPAETTEEVKAQEEEDPWIRSALSKLRSKNLY